MDQAYYREYFALERQHWWFRARAELLMGYLRRTLGSRSQSLRILNVGAATGRSSELLRQFGLVTSVEYDGPCCAFTRAQTGLDLVQASITHLPFPSDSFDLACCFDVIEHVQDDAAAVAELHRVCRGNGLMCFTVPAFMFLWSQHDQVNHHCRRYSGGQLREVIKRSGARLVFHSYFNFWLFFPIAGFRILQGLAPRKTSRQDAGSDFFAVQNPFLDKVFYAIFRTEAPLIRWGVRFPAGVSILSTWRKREQTAADALRPTL
jgi:SAM-dependent methyltransferase